MRRYAFVIWLTGFVCLFAALNGAPAYAQNVNAPFAASTVYVPLMQGGTFVPGDPLTGNGAVSRTLLSYNDLLNSTASALVDNSAYALPANAAMPAHEFQGRLVLNTEVSGGHNTLHDPYGYAAYPGYRHLPAFNFQFVQNGSHLIPVTQGLAYTGSLYWNYIVGPGRIWRESGDNGYSRVSLPFALIEYNQNCVHNGVLMFLFNGTAVSSVRYQIVQEGCAYFKFNQWGRWSATYTAETIGSAAALQVAHADEVKNRIPVRPFEQLSTDYPDAGADLTQYEKWISDMTVYGLYVDGKFYRSACSTRYGDYPFCDNMRLPSFSTAKSLVAGLAFLRLAQKYGSGIADLYIKDYVSEWNAAYVNGEWSSVTFNHAIDMATGNYQDPAFEVDEFENSGDFLAAVTYADKIQAAFKFPYKAEPGTFWNYHTTDSFIITRAMHKYLQSREGGSADIFNMLRDEVFKPLHLSAGALTTLRTDNNASGQTFGGYGLFLTADDVVKLSKFLNNDKGLIGGTQMLNASLLDATWQRNSKDRGLDTTEYDLKYNNHFWGDKIKSGEISGIDCTVWMVFQVGYGGNEIIHMPDGSTYFYFSDAEDYVWYPAVRETNKLSPMCSTEAALAPSNAHTVPTAPNATAPGSFASTIVMVNPNATAINATLTVRDPNGTVRYTTTANLAAKGSSSVTLPTNAAGYYGAATISSASPVHAFALNANSNQQAREMIQGADAPSNSLTFPVFRNLGGDANKSILAVQNSSSTTNASLTFHYYQADGTEAAGSPVTGISVPPLAAYYFDSYGMFGSSKVTYSVRVDATQPVAGAARVLYKKDSANARANVTSAADKDAYIHTITRKTDDADATTAWTEMYVRNNGASSATVTAKYYQTDGTKLASESKTIAPNGYAMFSTKNNTTLGASFTGFAKFTSDTAQPLAVQWFEASSKGNKWSGVNGMSAAQKNTKWLCGDTQRVTGGTTRYTKLYIVNPDSASANLTLTLYNASGGTVMSVNKSVGKGKQLILDFASSTFSSAGSSYAGATVIESTGGQGILVAASASYGSNGVTAENCVAAQ